MKNNGILHSRLIGVIGEMGHTDALVIADSGLPIPRDVERIDLALAAGIPSFIETLAVVLMELCVERCAVAAETKGQNDPIYQYLIGARRPERFADFTPPPNLEVLPDHAEFKRRCATARAIVRTGEASPYANIILYSGVTF